MKLDEFVEAYPPHHPSRPHANENELRELTEVDGVRLLAHPPAKNDNPHIPVKKGDPGCHLWVMRVDEIPYILEHALVSPPLESGKVKHTNLTGGGKASCGGEVWFETSEAERIYVNGCSGRYGPGLNEKRKLDAAVEVFQQMGYDVISFGWDRDANLPSMVLRHDDDNI